MSGYKSLNQYMQKKGKMNKYGFQPQTPWRRLSVQKRRKTYLQTYLLQTVSLTATTTAQSFMQKGPEVQRFCG